MSGHSKWATIKHKKAAQDAKKGRMFTKIIRELTVAAREGGGNSENNPRLRTAMERAKEINMPSDNVEKAIKRGTGELEGVSYDTCMFEGYGPGGIAIMVETLTDNKNRTSAEIRNIFTKKNGNLAGTGSVAWIFTKKGLLTIAKNKVSEDDLLSIVLDAGAEDVKTEAEFFEVTTDPKDFEKVKSALKEKQIVIEGGEITMIPSSAVKLGLQDAKQVLALVEALEDHDDTQHVYANFDIPDEIMAEIEKTMAE